MEQIRDRISEIINGADIVLFMKGVPQAPQCGFSAAVVQVLSALKVPYRAVDVMSDQAIREGVKAFAAWPTLPQLYVKGEFIGGCDIVREMHQSGELSLLLSRHGLGEPA